MVIDENYSTLTNHSKTTFYNTPTSCNQLRTINIKEKMRKNYCIDIEDIILAFYSHYVSFRLAQCLDNGRVVT
jgi:hypothetical protein